MIRRSVLFLIPAIQICFSPPSSNADVLCKSPNASVFARPACKQNETQLDPVALGLQFRTSCPPDSALVGGTICVDKYEASVWETTNASVIAKIKAGTVTLADL